MNSLPHGVNESADRDKDKRVSLLEAFNFSRLQTEKFYESEGRLLTEHALLDDNGDGAGSRVPSASAIAATDDSPQDNADGALAHRFFFDPAVLQSESDGLDPAKKRQRLQLTIDARQLVDQIERLKRRKNVLPVDDYSEQLEVLLVELALNRRSWRETKK